MKKEYLSDFSLSISNPRNGWLPYHGDPAHCFPPASQSYPSHVPSLLLVAQDFCADQRVSAQTPDLLQSPVVSTSTFSAH